MTKHSQDCVAIRRECRQIWQKLISLFCKLDVGYPETKIYGHPQEIEALSLEIYLLKTNNFLREAISIHIAQYNTCWRGSCEKNLTSAIGYLPSNLFYWLNEVNKSSYICWALSAFSDIMFVQILAEILNWPLEWRVPCKKLPQQINGRMTYNWIRLRWGPTGDHLTRTWN